MHIVFFSTSNVFRAEEILNDAKIDVRSFLLRLQTRHIVEFASKLKISRPKTLWKIWSMKS